MAIAPKIRWSRDPVTGFFACCVAITPWVVPVVGDGCAARIGPSLRTSMHWR